MLSFCRNVFGVCKGWIGFRLIKNTYLSFIYSTLSIVLRFISPDLAIIYHKFLLLSLYEKLSILSLTFRALCAINSCLDFLFDFIKIEDLLNPEGSSSTSSSNPTGENPNDPKNHPKRPKLDFIVNDDSNTKFKELAKDLQERREEVLESRRLIHASSKSTTLSDLGISYRRNNETYEKARMIREVFPGADCNFIINPRKIKIIGKFRPK